MAQDFLDHHQTLQIRIFTFEGDVIDGLRSLKGTIKRDFLIMNCDLITQVKAQHILDLHYTKGAAVTCFLYDTSVQMCQPKKEHTPDSLIAIDIKNQQIVHTCPKISNDPVKLSSRIFQQLLCLI
jgi:NDP-sugar pyrophosphorylase family protein